MARVHRVTKSAKEHTCGRGHVIPKGDPYLWAKPGFRTRRPLIRCVQHPFRESELSTGVRSEALAAREAFEDAIADVDSFEGLESARSDLESALEDYVNTRQEALDAWPNGNSQLEEFVYQAEGARDEVAGWQSNYTDADEPDEDWLNDEFAQAQENGEPTTREDLIEAWREERLEEERDELSDIVSGLDL